MHHLPYPLQGRQGDLALSSGAGRYFSSASRPSRGSEREDLPQSEESEFVER